MKQNNSRGSCFDAFSVREGRRCALCEKSLLSFADYAEKTEQQSHISAAHCYSRSLAEKYLQISGL